MDYTAAPLWFRVRKLVRYLRLYGPSRTLMKVRAQYHVRTGGHGASIPAEVPKPSVSTRNVGIVGCGNYAYSNIAFYLKKKYGDVIRSCADPVSARAKSLAKDFNADYFTDSGADLIADPAVRLVYIASNHSTHADYAVMALRAGKAVHIEKPHAVSRSQLVGLCRAMVETKGTVGLGFNRPLSRLGRRLRQELALQRSPAVMNWFVAGHELPRDHWYFQPEEGGRVLGNLCHWTDFMLQMIPRESRYPIRIIPARAQSSDSNVALALVFGDGSVGCITFSAMGHTFEGVRERFSVHSGDLMAQLDDFQKLTIEVGSQKKVYRNVFRDHGHSDSILGTYQSAFDLEGRGNRCEPGYVWETGDLFLAARDALESGEERVVRAFDDAVLR